MGGLSRGITFLHALYVPAWLHALRFADYRVLLCLRVTKLRPDPPHPAVLDQHGSRSDHDAGRRASDYCGPRLEFARRRLAVSERIYTVLLGSGDLVDTAAVHTRNLAARL